VNSIFDKRVNASLVDATHRPRGARLGDKWVLKCSGRGGDPLNDQQAPDIKALAARGFSVMHGTWVATNHWGKDAAQTEAIAGKTYVQNPANFAAASGPVPIIGSSMGGLIALLLLVNNPTLFSCVAVGIPAVSPIDIHDNNLGTYASDIESAYTNLAGWNAAKATHDPLTRAAEFVALKDRIKIWYSNNDPICRKTQVESFIATVGCAAVNMGDQTSGPVGYTGHGVYANFAAEAADFIAAHA
jgi:hypothetical protein